MENEFCTITVDHYRELVRTQMYMDLIVKLKEEDKFFYAGDLVKAYMKEGEKNE